MAISTGQVTVGTSRILIHQADADGCQISLRLDYLATGHIHIGGSDVSLLNGYVLEAGTVAQFDMQGADALYGIKTAGSVVVAKLVIG